MLFSRKAVLELGAGNGCYTKALYEAHTLKSIVAYEGASNVEEVTDFAVRWTDLTQPLPSNDMFDWVLCTEVGEHIPPAYQDVFLHNVLDHALEGVVLTWSATTSGVGHVNAKANWEVINMLADRSFSLDVGATVAMRRMAHGWFKPTSMVFRREPAHLSLPAASEVYAQQQQDFILQAAEG